MKVQFILICLFLSNLLFAQNIQYINANNAASSMNKIVSAIATQLTQNKDFTDQEDSIMLVTSFVSLEDLSKTSHLGNILNENLLHEMQIRGYKVIDFKTMKKLKIAKDGDFIMSRDISKLTKDIHATYVLTGTFTNYLRGTVINARIVDLKTHIILSSAQVFIPKRFLKKILSKQNRIITF